MRAWAVCVLAACSFAPHGDRGAGSDAPPPPDARADAPRDAVISVASDAPLDAPPGSCASECTAGTCSGSGVCVITDPGSDVTCPADYPCDVECHTDGTCNGLTIDCSKSPTSCVLDCHGNSSCNGATLECPGGSATCNEDCHGDSDCNDGTVVCPLMQICDYCLKPGDGNNFVCGGITAGDGACIGTNTGC